MTKEERKNYEHALYHLKANKIHVPYLVCGGWYYGNKTHFIKRHIKAIEMFEKMLEKRNNNP